MHGTAPNTNGLTTGFVYEAPFSPVQKRDGQSQGTALPRPKARKNQD
jgi:hypothetical protein